MSNAVIHMGRDNGDRSILARPDSLAVEREGEGRESVVPRCNSILFTRNDPRLHFLAKNFSCAKQPLIEIRIHQFVHFVFLRRSVWTKPTSRKWCRNQHSLVKIFHTHKKAIGRNSYTHTGSCTFFFLCFFSFFFLIKICAEKIRVGKKLCCNKVNIFSLKMCRGRKNKKLLVETHINQPRTTLFYENLCGEQIRVGKNDTGTC